MHRPARRRFPRNRVYVKGINHQFQIDLADMQSIAKSNDGFRYLLTCIDVFSKYAWAIPVKDKTGDETVRAFKIILNERVPKRVQSDQGREFLNYKFQRLLRDAGIKFFTCKNQQIKCSVVERFNRTIKGRIWKYFRKNRTYRYIDDIDDLVAGYNNTYHRSIKTKPKLVSKSNENLVRSNLYPEITTQKVPKLKIGDKVRVSKIKGTFEKGYLPNWSEEIFFIRKIIRRNPTLFELEDYAGEAIEGYWYETELQKVDVEKFWIEKVIKRKAGKVLVKWLGYSDKFNSWIPAKDIEHV